MKRGLWVAVAAVVVIGGGVAMSGEDATQAGEPAAITQDVDTSDADAPEEKAEPEASPEDQFTAWAEKNGTPQQLDAAQHVTRLQGLTKDIGLAEIHTDYTGGLTGPNGGSGKLLASLYASWQSTDSGAGLVTVYDETGGILATGNY